MSKIIIYGYTNLGSQIAKILSSLNYELIIVDFDEKRYKRAKKDGYRTYSSELLKDEKLIKIGIKDDIEAFYCVSDNANNNFFVTLSVRNLNKDIRIISKASNEKDKKKMYLAGASKVINPYEIGALRIFRILEKPFVSHFVNEIIFGKHNLGSEEFVVPKGSVLDGRYLDEFDFSKEFDIVLIGILDKELGDEFIFNYYTQRHKIDEGDVLVMMGYKNNLERFKNYLNGKA